LLSSNNFGQVVHTDVPLIKQYNLVPFKGWEGELWPRGEYW